MKSNKLIALVLLLVPTLALAKDKSKKSDVSPAFASATYVYVEAADGDIGNPGLDPSDRQAIADVQNALHDWKRYSLTAKRSEANLILVVRKGRVANPQVHIGASGSIRPQPGQPANQNPAQMQQPAGVAEMAETEAGPPEDLLRVYQIDPNGKRVGPIWNRSLRNGLDGPQLILFQQLKAAVERAYPPAPPTPPSQP